MAEDKNKKKKDLLRRLREWLLGKSKGGGGGRPGLEQIEELEKEAGNGKKK